LLARRLLLQLLVLIMYLHRLPAAQIRLIFHQAFRHSQASILSSANACATTIVDTTALKIVHLDPRNLPPVANVSSMIGHNKVLSLSRLKLGSSTEGDSGIMDKEGVVRELLLLLEL